MGKGEKLTESELRLRISSYCAYQERSPKQVQEKLSTLNTDAIINERVIKWATDEKFVSESRFAKNYVRGKFHLKKWGRYKIKAGLKAHDISTQIIGKAIAQLDNTNYVETLITLGIKKFQSIKKTDQNKWRKTENYLIGKGFETKLILENKEKIENG
jgi:regulatory protein